MNKEKQKYMQEIAKLRGSLTLLEEQLVDINKDYLFGTKINIKEYQKKAYEIRQIIGKKYQSLVMNRIALEQIK